jgi:hypothetical protein
LSIAKKGCLIAVLLGITILVWLTWPPWYRQDAIQTRLVDAESGEPIAGANAVAIWYTSHIPFGVEMKFRVAESTTNAAGWFAFPAWGPKRRPILGYLTDHDPEIWIYKFGYEGMRVDNARAYIPVIGRTANLPIWTPVRTPRPGEVAEKYPGWRSPSMHRFCFWNRRTIALKRTKTPEEDLHALSLVELAIENGGDVPLFSRAWQRALHQVPASAFVDGYAYLKGHRIDEPQEISK